LLLLSFNKAAIIRFIVRLSSWFSPSKPDFC
jgi:hypothetical protein